MARRHRRAGGSGLVLLAVPLLAVLLTAMLVRPAQSDPCIPPKAETVQRLLHWIAKETDYDVTRALADPPTIFFCEVGQRIPYEDHTMVIEPNDQGVYDPVHRRVHLVGAWSESRTRDVGILLHELVHHVQFLNRTWECPNASEWQAYKLHETWLAQQGIAAEFDWLRIHFQSKCPRDIHP